MPLSALPAFSDNYIWALTVEQGGTWLVDPGDATPVFAAEGLQPAGVLLTHHHPDHIGGVDALLRQWPGLPVVAPADERIPHATCRVHDNDVVRVAGGSFHVLAVPGHTRTHVAYHGEGLLFCGDTLFSLGCGRLFEGTPEQMYASLSRLAALPDATRVCCGHEYTVANAAFALTVDPDNSLLRDYAAQARLLRERGLPTLPSTIARERACNPFLRTSAPAIRRTLAARLGREPAGDVECLAELRRWKDGFVA